MLTLNEDLVMASIIFENLLKMKLIDEVDIIIYYNNHFCPNGLDICKGLDDCISVLIDAKMIDEDEIKDDIIEYHKTHFENNMEKIIELINEQNNEFDNLF